MAHDTADLDVLDEAKHILSKRAVSHGGSSAVHQRAAEFWSAILGTSVSAHQVQLCMIALKLARAVERPGNRDHYVDIAGYAQLAWREVDSMT